MRIALCQLNPTVGDISGNLRLLREALARISSQKVDLAVFSEMFLVGYPARDLLERGWFVERAEMALGEVAEISRQAGVGILVGGVARKKHPNKGKGLYNAAFLFAGGKEVFRQEKSLLPFYDVFDEVRYFDPAPKVNLYNFNGVELGISVCEDAWNSPILWGREIYQFDPIAEQARLGAKIFINIAASPFWTGKEEVRFNLIKGHIQKYHRPFVFLNQVGANEELVFDGRSFVLDGAGNPVKVLPGFEESVQVLEISPELKMPNSVSYTPIPIIESVYRALVLGISDYVHKCGFKKVVLGISGGIDSAVTACLAVAALGPEGVLGVTMPSEFSTPEGIADAEKLAQNLGIEIISIPITRIFHTYLDTLKPHFPSEENLIPDVTEENIQARIRGNLLMALSNKFGYLVLSTGNKSELAVGYCTLYGDMSGGLAVLADVPKTMVYELAQYINREREVIPHSIIQKPPSAELKPNQRDTDTLPPYPVLDEIIHLYVDEVLSLTEIVGRGFDRSVVEWVVKKIDRNEFKRRQIPPGIKVTTKAFGSGRRLPIVARYEH
ncbi:MAG: NAD+ synthase [candidate division WOR-3 bacterium]